MTSEVGTAMYVAPELKKSMNKTTYNQKVDVYSLGIIFMEMCYGPFPTAMGRVQTLLDVRKPDVILPSDMEVNMPAKANLLRFV